MSRNISWRDNASWTMVFFFYYFEDWSIFQNGVRFSRVTIRSTEKWKPVHRWKSMTKHNYILMQVTRGRPLHCRSLLKYVTKFREKSERKSREKQCMYKTYKEKLFLIRNWVSQTVLQCWTFPPLCTSFIGFNLELLLLSAWDEFNKYR